MQRQFSCPPVCLTVSLRCPRVSALWPNRASAVSWKHVTHWLSPKSAKLAWERGTGRDDEWARDYLYVYVCVRSCIFMEVTIILITVCITTTIDVHCAHLQKVRVCIWSWGTLCYTFRSGTAHSAGRWPSCCSLQMDRLGTDNSPYECTALSPRSWNTVPENGTQKHIYLITGVELDCYKHQIILLQSDCLGSCS